MPAEREPATGAAFTGLVSEAAWTGELFAKAVDEFRKALTGPTVLVLDNASIHRAATQMFAAINAHDIPKLMSYFAPNLEFYHDKVG